MRIKFYILFFLYTFISYSQNEASNWYFGLNAGLRFLNDGTVVPLSDGLLSTEEGCSTISDSNGNLLFYTDGRTVWDRNHVVMPNGNYLAGTGLYGDPSSTQSGIIVPRPNSSTQYYIFTVDEPHHENAAVYPNAFSGSYVEFGSGSVPETDDGKNNGLNYSLVDLSVTGNNGSVGNVISSNNHLITYNTATNGEEIKYKCSEKITAVKNELDNTYWVITHFVNKFYAFKVDANGVFSMPVISTIGSNQQLSGYRRNALGYLKASPDGSKLAIAHQQNGIAVGQSALGTGSVELFDFDISTGIVSNNLSIIPNVQAYGVEFSPSSNRLYATYRVGSNPTMELAQFDLTQTNPSQTKQVIFDGVNYLFALQLAPNNKIYCATGYQGSLGVIANPDNLGLSCDYSQIGQFLASGKTVQLGLPPFITSFFNATIQVSNNCLGQTTSFSISANQSVTSVLWNFGDGSTSTILNPQHLYTTSGSYNVSVQITSGNESTTRSKEITIYQVPQANQLAIQTLCISTTAYQLSQNNASLLGSQSASEIGVSYFLTEQNAINGINPLPDPYNIAYGINTFYAKLYTIQNPSCYTITSFEVHAFLQPIVYQPTDFKYCEAPPHTGFYNFDLSLKNTEVLNGQSTAVFGVSYHLSSIEAVTGTNPLTSFYTNVTSPQTIHARVYNLLSPNCFATTSFSLIVGKLPVLSTVSAMIVCDDAVNDGLTSFDLTTKNDEILNGQSTNEFFVTFHPTLSDAENNQNLINGLFQNSQNPQIIFYAIRNTNTTSCHVIGNFSIETSYSPIANQIPAIWLCDDESNDGIEQFQLSDFTASIIGNQNPQLLQVSYHYTINDATASINSIQSPFFNTMNPQTIYARVQNNLNATCYETTSFQVGVSSFPIAFMVSDLIACDEVSNNQQEAFDLSTQIPAVLGNQSSANYAVSFYSSLTDAATGTNAIDLLFTNTVNPQTIYARVENVNNQDCYSLTTFDLHVVPKPLLQMEDIYSICEGSSIVITAPDGFDSYLWSTGETSESITISQSGNYQLTVFQNNGLIICDAIENFTVVNSSIATITEIVTTDWTLNNNSIQVFVSGSGNYIYSLDGINYQISSIFNNLPPGDFTIYVKDSNGCGIIEESIFLLMYPYFFTPNGDGYNDFWQVYQSFKEPTMEISIFDRYGKLVKTFNGLSPGWDGIYNGLPLPSSDYWFVVKRANGKVHKGHFSLKR